MSESSVKTLNGLDDPVIKIKDDFDDSTSYPLITREMEEVEEELQAKTAEEEEKRREELEEKEENELKEQRYKRLMHLLTRSQFYTDFMIKKLNAQKDEQQKKSRSRHPKGQTSKGESSGGGKSLRERNENPSSQSSSDSSPIRKYAPKSRGVENTARAKRKRNTYKISEIIDKETITHIEKKGKFDAAPVSSENDSPDQEQMRETAYGFMVSERQPLLFEGGVLRPYQLDGLDWLKLLYENGVNGILADEMGLGKTLQVIALLCHLIEMHITGPFLVIAPLSTLPNWVLEFERFAPKVPVILFHGNENKRHSLYSSLCKKNEVNNVSVCPVVLTSYEIPLRDKILRKIKWSYIIVDEGHRLKNYKCMLARELKEYRTGNRLLLTGTPLQNNLSELWSLLNFLLPEIFDDLAVFEAWFDVSELQHSESNEKIIEQEKQKSVLSVMHQILTPFLLRRVKADVALNIPPKKELLVYAPMSPVQLDLYRATVEHNYSKLFRKSEESLIIPDQPDGKRAKRKIASKRKSYAYDIVNSDDEFDEDSNPGSKYDIIINDKEDKDYKILLKMLHPMMQLRKIVNHPYLVHFPLVPGKKELRVDEELINKSGKLLVLDAMLVKLKERGHKILLFSTFTTLLDLLEEYVQMRDYRYVRLDGNVKLEDRQERIKLFNTDPDLFIFLISTRAGGLGINLTSADTVIIYDSDWNPQVDLQAQDRCHRIGQTRPVVVYRFVTAGTVDEQIVERAAAKRKLEKMVIQRGKFKLNQKGEQDHINLRELLDLLNSRDHQKVIHSNGYVFTDEELDALLDRSDLLAEHAENQMQAKSKTDNKIYKVVDQQSGSQPS
ncbi:lymphocyte-specific helicase-like [Periplaneta americana]|uniref:lymphocyte-specific helicase-like n=1 Tax=Periplaneta americana TaxID=6978 RepID=UPI0037E7ACD1